MTPADISVVIPAINEEAEIGAAIQSAFLAGAGEVIVADGGSQDATITEAEKWGATKVVHSLPGRGVQLNAGAALVDPVKEAIVFLHADNRLGDQCLKQICEQDCISWGAFHQRIQSKRLVFRMMEWGNAIAVIFRRVPFGDQAIFVTKAHFLRLGGFEEISLMEDIAFARKMRRHHKPVLLEGPIMVSSRRWEKRGVLRQTLQNWALQFAYSVGVSPGRLSRWYR